MGEPLKWAAVIIRVPVLAGFNVTYSVIAGSTLNTIGQVHFNVDLDYRIYIWIMAMFFIFPMCCVRRVKGLSFFAFINFLVIIYVTIVVFALGF